MRFRESVRPAGKLFFRGRRIFMIVMVPVCDRGMIKITSLPNHIPEQLKEHIQARYHTKLIRQSYEQTIKQIDARSQIILISKQAYPVLIISLLPIPSLTPSFLSHMIQSMRA